MKRNCLLLLLLVILCSTRANAQEYFYYYYGEKIPLTLNENKVCVNIPKEYGETCKRIRANVRVLTTVRDDVFDIIVVSLSDYEKLTSMDFWEEDTKYVILTRSFFTERNVEVFSTPYIYLRLKDEQDKDLLNVYSEKYKLNIHWNSPWLPLWYSLNVTLETKKSPMECANELYESGDFSSSQPDLAGGIGIADTEGVKSAVKAPTKDSSEIIDLQGRSVTGTPRPGIYIQQGRKRVVR